MHVLLDCQIIEFIKEFNGQIYKLLKYNKYTGYYSHLWKKIINWHKDCFI